MADFSAVLKKTIDGLSENTPDMRAKVYDKARATIESKLAAATPPPSSAVAERQRQMLEEAIAAVEAEYGEEPVDSPEEENEFDRIFAEHDDAGTGAGVAGFEAEDGKPERTEAQAGGTPGEPGSSEAREQDAISSDEPSQAAVPPVADQAADLEAAGVPPSVSGPERDEEGHGPEGAGEDGEAPYAQQEMPARRRRSWIGVVIGLVVLAALAAAGYGAWLNRTELAAIFGMMPSENGTVDDEPAEGGTSPAGANSGGGAGETRETESEAAAAATDTQAPASARESTEEAGAADGTVGEEARPNRKFTQRLTPSGKEIDEGPAGGSPTLGEGTSVSSATAPSNGEGAPQTADQNAVPVGQRAIFYEERTNSAQGSAQTGSVVWSLVKESPGDDLPPEAAIRAEASIPENDVQLRLTIRRNADPSLPASHIIEMIFLTPDDFEGGGIESVLRIAMKQSEQDTGSPLLGVPAKIADGFFLVALNDTKADLETNRTLLRRQEWIDIPIIYKSGRRALITLEKGIPGDKVFDEALDAWQGSSSG